MNERAENLILSQLLLDPKDPQAFILLGKVFEDNDFLTCGKHVSLFEKEVCEYIGSNYGVAISSGTAGLHVACLSIGLNKGDEVIIPAISFAASSNCVLYCGAKPVFCDIDEETMNIDIDKIESLITNKTKAIICVDFAGQLAINPPSPHC